MKRNSDTNRRPRKLLAAVFGLAAVGLAILVVAISAAGGASPPAGHPAAGGRPTPVAHVVKPTGHAARAVKMANARVPTAVKTQSPKAAANSRSAIPQNNGGDGDPDNNGASSDGDGDI